ncbi:hypothetical protein Efla_002405 [Eimeria flavescens]
MCALLCMAPRPFAAAASHTLPGGAAAALPGAAAAASNASHLKHLSRACCCLCCSSRDGRRAASPSSSSCCCCSAASQQQQQQQQQRRWFSKIVRWRADTPLAHRLEGFANAEDFLKACAQSKEQMTRRDWLAALSLLSTRRRLDLRSPAFRAFVAAALQQQQLMRAPYIHLTIHRFAVLAYGPALWQLAMQLLPLLQQQQLSSKQLAVCAWGLAKGGVTHPPLWDLIGGEALRLKESLSVSDLSMILWAFARLECGKPAELVSLKEVVLQRLDRFVQQTLHLHAAAAAAAAGGNSAAAAAAAQDLLQPAEPPSGARDLSANPAATAAATPPSAAAASAAAAAAAAGRAADEVSACPPAPPAAAGAAAACMVSPHDLCMLLRSFATLTPRDTPFIIRLLYALLLACRVQPPATAAAKDMHSEAEPWGLAGGGLGPLTAQGLTAVWTALKDANITEVFALPQHKRPVSSSSNSSSSTSRHKAYLPFRESVPVECLPLLLPILKPSLARATGLSIPAAAAGAAPAAAAAAAAAPANFVGEAAESAAATVAAAASAASAARSATGAASAAEAAAAPAAAAPAAAAAAAAGRITGGVGLRSPALLHSACCSILLEVLCEETRQLRLDHTTNTNMAALLAAALADMQLVDPRVIYQLVLFSLRKGAAQFQGEQLLKVLSAFEACGIVDAKAWDRLAHRAQDVAADLDLKGLHRIRRLLRKSGHSNARVEGVLDHFEALKEDINRCGPL